MTFRPDSPFPPVGSTASRLNEPPSLFQPDETTPRTVLIEALAYFSLPTTRGRI